MFFPPSIQAEFTSGDTNRWWDWRSNLMQNSLFFFTWWMNYHDKKDAADSSYVNNDAWLPPNASDVQRKTKKGQTHTLNHIKFLLQPCAAYLCINPPFPIQNEINIFVKNKRFKNYKHGCFFNIKSHLHINCRWIELRKNKKGIHFWPKLRFNHVFVFYLSGKKICKSVCAKDFLHEHFCVLWFSYKLSLKTLRQISSYLMLFALLFIPGAAAEHIHPSESESRTIVRKHLPTLRTRSKYEHSQRSQDCQQLHVHLA